MSISMKSYLGPTMMAMIVATPIVHNPQSKNEEIDHKLYKPTIVGGDWIVSETDLCMNLNHFKVYSVAYLMI